LLHSFTLCLGVRTKGCEAAWQGAGAKGPRGGQFDCRLLEHQQAVKQVVNCVVWESHTKRPRAAVR
jgi:hypothetical protein